MSASSPGRSRRLWLVLSVVFVVLAAGVVGRQAFRDDSRPVPPTASTSVPTPTVPPCPAQPTDRSGSKDGVLKIGTIFPLTGRELNSYAPQLTAAADMAVHDVNQPDVNQPGGIPGLGPVQLTAALDEGVPGSPTTCASVSTLLADRVDAIVGPFASQDTLAAYQRVTGAGTLMVSPANTLNALSSIQSHDLFFRTTSSNTVQGKALADLVADDQNRNVLVVASDEIFATDLADSITNELRGRSVPFDLLHYDHRAPARNDIADRIIDQHYGSVVFVGFGEVADIISTLLDRGVTPANLHMYGGTGFVENTFADRASPAPGDPARLAGLTGFVPAADAAFNEQLKNFRAGLQDLTYGAQTYDAVIAISLAAAAAHSDDPTQIAAQLPLVTRGGQTCRSYQDCLGLLEQNPNADIDYDGASGPLGFTSRRDSRGDLCQAQYLLSAFDAGKHLSTVRRTGISTDQCG